MGVRGAIGEAGAAVPFVVSTAIFIALVWLVTAVIVAPGMSHVELGDGLLLLYPSSERGWYLHYSNPGTGRGWSVGPVVSLGWVDGDLGVRDPDGEYVVDTGTMHLLALDDYARREGGAAADYRPRLDCCSPGEFASDRTPSYTWLFALEAVAVIGIVLGGTRLMRGGGGVTPPSERQGTEKLNETP
jgi:hypothetical protein